MNTDENPSRSASHSSIPIPDAEITEETPLTEPQTDEPPQEEILPFVFPEAYEWDTSLISQICREGDMHRIRLFVGYSRDMITLAKHASEIADRLDIENGLSPLHHAARYNQLHICLMLLSNIDFVLGVNIKDENGRTPLHYAYRSSTNVLNTEGDFPLELDFGDRIQNAQLWQEEYSEKILTSDHPLTYLFARAKANINAQDKYLLTPLHYAIARNSLAGVKQLITLSASIELADRQGIRPLHLACKDGNLTIVKYLLDHSAQIDATDAEGWTPMHHACAKGYLEIIELINATDNVLFSQLLQMKTNTNATCLHLSVQNGSIQLVEYILHELAKNGLTRLINEQAEPFGTSLHLAAKFCEPPMLRLLCDHRADPSILNSHEQSPLHIASASNRLSIVEALVDLSQSSLLEIEDDNGQTALSVTTNVDIVEKLISFGADIASLDNNHMNALMIAVSRGHLDIVNCLLSAIRENSFDILDQTEKRHDYSLFLIAIKTGLIEMCSLLLEHPYIPWNTVDRQGMNAFHLAAQNNHHELIEFLCKHISKTNPSSPRTSRSYSFSATTSVDMTNPSQKSSTLHTHIDAQTEDGQTPLHLASAQGHTQSIGILLQYGADILLANDLGQLPIHAAIQNGHGECVDLLMKAGTKHLAEFQSALMRKQSPLITACQNGYADIVQLLISENLGVDYGMSSDEGEEDNPLAVAIKHRRMETVHVLLEHPHTEHWLTLIRDTDKTIHQTPLRDMIKTMPDCARHTFDKLLLKTSEYDDAGNVRERFVYRYKFIDDYFMEDGTLYSKSSRQLYRNHPLVIAADHGHGFLLDHPLVKHLMARKWILYRPLFYIPRVLSFLLLATLFLFALTVPATLVISPSTATDRSTSLYRVVIRRTILILSIINLSKIILEILLYRGFRSPYAQLFGMVSFLSSILAFMPLKNVTTETIAWQWELASFSILFQCFNTAVIFRSVPSMGKFIVLIESILRKFFILIFVMSPLLIAFTLSSKMIFFNQAGFFTFFGSFHKSSAMITGEFDYETLFFSKSTFTATTFIFIPFIVIMFLVFMNLLLGVAIGDIQTSLNNALAKANAFWIRELIYIEATLPHRVWLKSNVIEQEIDKEFLKSSIANETDNEEDEEKPPGDRSHGVELKKLLEILEMLCTQAKQVLDYETHLEKMLKQLSTTRASRESLSSTGS